MNSPGILNRHLKFYFEERDKILMIDNNILVVFKYVDIIVYTLQS